MSTHPRRGIAWVFVASVLVAGFSFSATASPPQERRGSEARPSRPRPPRLPWLAVSDGTGTPAAPDQPLVLRSVDARGQNFANEIPAQEISIGGLLGSVPGHDTWAWVGGRSDGRVVLLTGEGFALQAAQSDDGGATFGAEVRIAGGPGEPPALVGDASTVATLSADGRIYVAYRSGDPLGEVGLRFVRSDDMGLSWTAPLELIRSGDPLHGVVELGGISANAGGRVALVFRERWEHKDNYVMAGLGGGASWTSPVRVDPGDTDGTVGSIRARIAVDWVGRIHVVYRQSRPGLGSRIWYTRSTDGGVSFETERDFDAVLPPGERQYSDCPAVVIADDGSVLITFYDRFGGGRIYVVRSTTGGADFAQTFQADVDTAYADAWPRLVTAPGTGTVLLGMVRSDGRFEVWRSANHGADFGSATTIATTAWIPPYAPGTPGSHLGFARTAAGHWLVAWDDARSAGADATLTDVYARVSTDDGVTWGAEQRVDRFPPAATESRLISEVVTTGSDELFVGYRDRRDGAGTEWNVYANRSAAVPLDFSGNERRVDADSTTDNYFGSLDYNEAAVTTDGDHHVYVAFNRAAAGLWPDIYVAASEDGGRTFPVVRRVSTSDGLEDCLDPQIVAHPDGTVYVAFLIKREETVLLAFNRSLDFGQTWLTEQRIVANAGSWDLDWGTFRLSSPASGKVHLAWAAGYTVVLTRSINGGDTFTTALVEEGFNPALCTQGDQVFVVFAAFDNLEGGVSVYGVVSEDNGESWGAITSLRSSGLFADAYDTDVACDGAGGALAVWNDWRDDIGVYASRFDGGSWGAERSVNAPASWGLIWPRALFVNPSVVLVSYSDFSSPSIYDGSSCWVSRSADGGLTWGVPLQVDEAAPQPLASSYFPALATDGQGRVWVSWMDYSAGGAAIAARLSQDDGASFGATYRAGHGLPQGSRMEVGQLYQQTSALPGTAFFVFDAMRSGSLYDVILNTWDFDDFDRDGAKSAPDCNDEDPQTWAAPQEVTGLALVEVAEGTRLDWDSQAGSAGNSTVYDLVSGWLSELRADGAFTGSYCLKHDQLASPFTDTHPAPPTGDGYYYLVRGDNACGTGTYGATALMPDPREVLDTAGPCP